MVNDWLFETAIAGVTLMSVALAILCIGRMLSEKYLPGELPLSSRQQRQNADRVGSGNQDDQQGAKSIIEHVAAAIWMSNADGSRLLFANAACAKIFGAALADPAEGRPGDDAQILQRFVHPEDEGRLQQALALRAADDCYEVNYRILRNKRQRYIRETGKVIFDANGERQYVISSAMDISSEMAVRDELCSLNSQLREANLRLRESARRDNLTQCLNRAAFLDQAEKALHMEQRYGRSSTLIFFDLNDFKQLNDNFGHHIGDRGLIEFAEQVKARLRTTDELGRYGGDEFVVLLRETDAAQAQQLLVSLLPVVIDAENGNSIILRYSAGIASSNAPDIGSVDDWLRNADSQMYHQKIRRRNS
jgi:diguanylate cyclase (GGDEF)-like protein/PAS domain S-box-containing protein